MNSRGRTGWLVLLMAAACTCAAQSRPAQAIEAMLKEIEEVSARRQSVDGALGSVLQRVLVTIEAAGSYPSTAEERPSDAFMRMAGRQPSAQTSAMARLLDAAMRSQTIPSKLSEGCEPGADPDFRAAARTPAYERAAKRLDALVRLKFMPCNHPGIRLNNPAASQPSSMNSKEVAWQKQQKADTEANAPFAVPAADRTAVMLAQAFRFSESDDGKIGIPLYLQQQIELAVERNQRLIDSTNAGPRPTVVFDRTRTESGTQLINNPKGWFSAFFEPRNNRLYLSPTLARAALVSCASRTQYRMGEPQVLLGTIRASVVRGMNTPNDLLGRIRGVNGGVTHMNECLAAELDFLMGHELAHAIGIDVESHADCIGLAAARQHGHASAGILQSLIFDVGRTDDYPVLGLDEVGRTRLICRADRFAAARALAPSAADFAGQLRACIKEPPVCE